MVTKGGVGGRSIRGRWSKVKTSSYKTVKNLPAVWETWLRSLGCEGPLKEGMATHSSILAWRIPIYIGAWQITVHGVAKQ